MEAWAAFCEPRAAGMVVQIDKRQHDYSLKRLAFEFPGNTGCRQHFCNLLTGCSVVRKTKDGRYICNDGFLLFKHVGAIFGCLQ